MELLLGQKMCIDVWWYCNSLGHLRSKAIYLYPMYICRWWRWWFLLGFRLILRPSLCVVHHQNYSGELANDWIHKNRHYHKCIILPNRLLNQPASPKTVSSVLLLSACSPLLNFMEQEERGAVNTNDHSSISLKLGYCHSHQTLTSTYNVFQISVT